MSYTVSVAAPSTSAPLLAGELELDSLAAAFHIPCIVRLDIPVTAFTVGTLMELTVGSLIETDAQQNEDLELSVNGQLIGSVEIEVTGDKLAVRLTGIA